MHKKALYALSVLMGAVPMVQAQVVPSHYACVVVVKSPPLEVGENEWDSRPIIDARFGMASYFEPPTTEKIARDVNVTPEQQSFVAPLKKEMKCDEEKAQCGEWFADSLKDCNDLFTFAKGKQQGKKIASTE